MSEDTRLGMQPPGWLYDSETGQTRWWNGVRWTEHAKPLDPVVRTGPVPSAPHAAAMTASTVPSSKNGPAKAALVLLLLAVLGVAGLIWLASGMDPTVAAVAGLAQIGLVVAAFILSIVGLVLAIVRPTRKREAIFGLVLSALLLGFMVFRILTAPATIDSAALEGEIEAWALEQTGEVTQVTCPANPPTATGALFTCTAVGASGTTWAVAVNVADDTLTWDVAP